MAKRTSIDDVEEAVQAVRVLQDQIATLLEAMSRLTVRVEAIERNLAQGSKNV
jgi:hypothetical protein